MIAPHLLCGFSEPNYVARLFKKMEGMTPGQFRTGLSEELH